MGGSGKELQFPRKVYYIVERNGPKEATTKTNSFRKNNANLESGADIPGLCARLERHPRRPHPRGHPGGQLLPPKLECTRVLASPEGGLHEVRVGDLSGLHEGREVVRPLLHRGENLGGGKRGGGGGGDD